MVRLQEQKGRFFVTIPKEYIKDKKWKKGDTLVVGYDDKGRITIKRVGD